MAALLPACSLLLILSNPVFSLEDTVSRVQSTTTFEVLEAEIPTSAEGNDTADEASSQACIGEKCGIHVFRVALSSRPEEVGDVVPVKQRKKYGSNVYVPRGSQDTFVLRDKVENIPVFIDSRVKDRIHDQEFVIKPVDAHGGVWIKDGDPLPKNFESIRFGPTVANPPKKEGLSMAEVLLLIVTGILFGILLTAACFGCIVYNRRPRIDRSSVVSHRRHLSQETLPLHSVSSAGRYPPLQLPSSLRSTDSSRSTFDGSLELAILDDSSFRTRSTSRNYRQQTPQHTRSEFEAISRKISI